MIINLNEDVRMAWQLRRICFRSMQLLVLLIAIVCGIVMYKLPPFPVQSAGIRFSNASNVFGHNGGGEFAPENTLASIRFDL